MNEIINFAMVIGNYKDITTEMQSNSVVTILTNNLKITKKASKDIWATGNLMYTITIINPTKANYENIVITDILNPALIQLITESLRINGIPAGYGTFSYSNETGILIIHLSVVGPDEVIVIQFFVKKYKSEIFTLENYATINFDNNTITSNTVIVSALSEICKCKEIQRNNLN